MKITNKNIGWWILFAIFLIWCHSMWTHGINGQDLTFREFFNLVGVIVFTATGISSVIIGIATLIRMCANDEIEFEIDILKPFRSRHIPPEEEDKQNK